NCDPDEIFFTSGATEANNLAILGIARGQFARKRHRILVSSIEHSSVLETAKALERDSKYIIEYIPVDSEGFVDTGFLNKTLNEDVLLVSVMAVNNEIGTIQPIELIGKYVSSFGAVFHCDAAQALCAIDIDVISQHIDLLSISGHKLY